MRSFVRQSLLFALVFAALLLNAGCQSDLSAEEYVASARDHREKGNLPEAIIQLKNALRKDPNNAEGRFLLGRIYLDQGDLLAAEDQLHKAVDLGLPPQEAELSLARALSLRGKYQQLIESEVDLESVPLPDRGELLALNGDAYLALGNPARAEEFYNASLAIDADNPYATTGKANILLARNDRDAARTQLLAILKATPDFAPAWRLLGLLDISEGKLAEAEKSITKAIQNSAYIDDDLYTRATLRIRLKELDGAKADIQALRMKHPQNPNIDYAEGILQYAQGNIAEAQARFETVLGAVPDNPPALYWSGLTNTLLGNLPLAETRLQRFLAINPENTVARRLLAQVQLESGNPAEARKLALQVLQEVPDDLASMGLLADVSDRLGDRAAAVDYSKRLAAARPESPEALARLGTALVNSGEADEGLRQLQLAAELDPESGGAAQALVQQYLQRGDLDGALKAARDYSDRKPDDAAGFVSLGLVHLKRQEVAQATAAFQRTLELEPSNTSANQGMALIAIRQQDYGSAEAYLLKALESRQGDLQTLMNLANLKALQADPGAQKMYLEQAIASNPEAIPPRLKLGRIKLASGDAPGAISTIDVVMSAQVGNRDLLGLLAEAQVADGRFADAVATLTRLDKQAPGDARVQYYFALAYEGLQDLVKMRDALQKSAELDPGYLPAKIGLGNLAIRDGDAAAAESWLAQAKTQAGADNVDVILIEARLAELKRDWTGAATAYQKLLDIRPAGSILRLQAQARWNAGDTAGALKVYEQWLKEYPEDTRTRLEMAQRLLNLGRPEEAVASYQTVLETNPEDPIALNNLGSLLVGTEPAKALEYARRAHELSPQTPAVMDTLALALLRTGDTERAARMVDRALAEQPDNPYFLYHQAQVQEAEGRGQAAIQTLDKVLHSGREFADRAEAEAMLARLRAGP